jgi:molybdopterin-guanine dinucleotide biosynthesis protein A
MKNSIVIQAGGRSQRMGENKALLSFHGETLIERIISRVKDIAEELVITSNQPEELEFLPPPVFADVIKDKGALGGLLTAFSIVTSPVVIVVACDMPFVNATLLAAELEEIERGPFDAVVPRTDFGSEPFHSVYRREPCLDAVNSSLDQGLRRADSWHPLVKTRYVDAGFCKGYDPHGLAFFNINTPEDYQKALTLAGSNPKY